MRIAWVSPYLPAPANTGRRIRIRRLAEALSHHDLHLFCAIAPEDPDPRSLPPSAVGPWSSVTSMRQLQVRLALRAPRPACAVPPDLMLSLQAADRVLPFDLVIAEHCFSLRDFPPMKHAPLLIDEHDVESERCLDGAARSPRKLMQSACWRRFERRAWKRADLVVASKQADSERIGAVRGAACPVVPDGVALDRCRYIPPSQRPGSGVLFVGSMSREPDIRAAELLARKVLPIVRSHVPDASLTLAGRDPGPGIRALASKNVCVTGTLDDLGPTFESHAVYASAIDSGAGCSTRILEALASGIPVVSSPAGIRGFELGHEDHCLVAATPKLLAASIAAVLTARQDFDPMASRAHAVAIPFDWSVIAARFRDVAEAAAARGRSLGPSARMAPPSSSR